MSSIEVFADEAEGIEGVGLVVRDASILEYDGELVPGVKLTPADARSLAAALNEFADSLEGYQCL